MVRPGPIFTHPAFLSHTHTHLIAMSLNLLSFICPLPPWRRPLRRCPLFVLGLTTQSRFSLLIVGRRAISPPLRGGTTHTYKRWPASTSNTHNIHTHLGLAQQPSHNKSQHISSPLKASRQPSFVAAFLCAFASLGDRRARALAPLALPPPPFPHDAHRRAARMPPPEKRCPPSEGVGGRGEQEEENSFFGTPQTRRACCTQKATHTHIMHTVKQHP